MEFSWQEYWSGLPDKEHLNINFSLPLLGTDLPSSVHYAFESWVNQTNTSSTIKIDFSSGTSHATSLKRTFLSQSRGWLPEVDYLVHADIFGKIRWWRIHLQCRRPRFDPWVGKIPWRRKWLPTPVFLPGEFQEEPGGLWSMGSQETTEWLTLSLLCMKPVYYFS